MATESPFRPSAEFAFVCASIAPVRDTVRHVADLDPLLLTAIARRHQVVPLVIAALSHRGMPVPRPLAARHDPFEPLRAASEAVRLDRLLTADGIEPLFLKGSTLAILAYGSLELRQFGDIDLLVRPDQATRAARTLIDADYRLPNDTGDASERIARLSRVAKDIEFRHAASGQIVELHWRMTDDPRKGEACERADSQRVELVPGRALSTLEPLALFTYLCGHGAAHGWARLRWLADVAALVAREADGGDRFWRAAIRHRRAVAAASAILLSKRYFGTQPPPAFVRPRSVRLALLLWLSRRTIEAGGGTIDLAHSRWRGWTETIAKLLLAATPGDLAGWWLRLLFSVGADEPVGRTRLWYVTHPLLRIPRLVRRRWRRAMPSRA